VIIIKKNLSGSWLLVICGFKLLVLNSKIEGIGDVCKLHISLLLFFKKNLWVCSDFFFSPPIFTWLIV
jgi:hypothetical protein